MHPAIKNKRIQIMKKFKATTTEVQEVISLTMTGFLISSTSPDWKCSNNGLLSKYF